MANLKQSKDLIQPTFITPWLISTIEPDTNFKSFKD